MFRPTDFQNDGSRLIRVAWSVIEIAETKPSCLGTKLVLNQPSLCEIPSSSFVITLDETTE